MDDLIKDRIENTVLTLQQIADSLGSTYKIVYRVWKTYPKEYRVNRKKANYRKSKLGMKNPMKGKTLEKHPRYIGRVSDCKGYLLVVKPDWYTGRRSSHHIFEHSKVWCEHNNLTEIPKGFIVHHCDMDKTNNDISNLIMMEMGLHSKLHHILGSVTTISKESTTKWLEAERRGDTHDIVSSL